MRNSKVTVCPHIEQTGKARFNERQLGSGFGTTKACEP
jgi:hypothetical protein